MSLSRQPQYRRNLLYSNIAVLQSIGVPLKNRNLRTRFRFHNNATSSKLDDDHRTSLRLRCACFTRQGQAYASRNAFSPKNSQGSAPNGRSHRPSTFRTGICRKSRTCPSALSSSLLAPSRHGGPNWPTRYEIGWSRMIAPPASLATSKRPSSRRASARDRRDLHRVPLQPGA